MSQDSTFIEIDTSGDLTVKVVEYNYNMTSADGGHPILKEAQLKVRREVLVKSSKVFKAMLTGFFAEAKKNEVLLEEDTVASMELWFLAIHGKLEIVAYNLPIKEIWETIAVGQKYNLDARQLEPWFETYWQSLDKASISFEDLNSYMYPCQIFDNAKAFAYITERIAYEASLPVRDFNPTRHDDLHVEGRVLQQLNAVRGSVRRKIIGGLFNPLKDIRNCRCAKSKDAVCSYLDGIFLTNVWPLDNNGKISNKEIIDGPGIVDWKCELQEGACSICTDKLEGQHIKPLCRYVQNYWQGLCLDCMNITRPKTGNIHTDYWQHNALEDWDSKCRITHGRNTWYFSFMGRPEIMSSYLREQTLNRR
ncbi:hypothetical protein BP6252_00233 [Coleophoma cylindrospora]|uniref:BTB domain-containing protein n=1 Tax=Coleophoma cylindrospora TaxID=1849047 RepID=A0A3D8SPU8_9HELO|nr:hypothetical protein BP6252_00233 [Coleophoma cylindrospora]